MWHFGAGYTQISNPPILRVAGHWPKWALILLTNSDLFWKESSLSLKEFLHVPPRREVLRLPCWKTVLPYPHNPSTACLPAFTIEIRTPNVGTNTLHGWYRYRSCPICSMSIYLDISSVWASTEAPWVWMFDFDGLEWLGNHLIRPVINWAKKNKF